MDIEGRFSGSTQRQWQRYELMSSETSPHVVSREHHQTLNSDPIRRDTGYSSLQADRIHLPRIEPSPHPPHKSRNLPTAPARSEDIISDLVETVKMELRRRGIDARRNHSPRVECQCYKRTFENDLKEILHAFKSLEIVSQARPTNSTEIQTQNQKKSKINSEDIIKRLDFYEAQLKSARESNDKLLQERASVSKEIEGVVERYKTEMTSLKQDVGTRDTIQAQLCQTIDRLTEMQSDNEVRLTELSSDNSRLRERIAKLDKSRVKIEEELRNAQKQIEGKRDLETRNFELNEQNLQLQEEIGRLKEKMKANQEVEQLKEEIKRLKSHENPQIEIDRLKRLVQESHDNFVRVSSKMAAELERTRTQAPNENKDTIQALEKEREKGHTVVMKLKTSLHDAQADIEGLKEALGRAKNESRSWKNRCLDMEDRVSDMKYALSLSPLRFPHINTKMNGKIQLDERNGLQLDPKQLKVGPSRNDGTWIQSAFQ